MSKYPNMMVLAPESYCRYGIWALMPPYLGTWALWDCHLELIGARGSRTSYGHMKLVHRILLLDYIMVEVSYRIHILPGLASRNACGGEIVLLISGATFM